MHQLAKLYRDLPRKFKKGVAFQQPQSFALIKSRINTVEWTVGEFNFLKSGYCPPLLTSKNIHILLQIKHRFIIWYLQIPYYKSQHGHTLIQ